MSTNIDPTPKGTPKGNTPKIAHKSSPFNLFLRKLRKQKVALIALGVIGTIVLIAFTAPYIMPYDPNRPVTSQYPGKGIDVSYLFGDQISCSLVVDGDSVSQFLGKAFPANAKLDVSSGNRRVASVRAEGTSLVVTAVNAGTTFAKVSYGEATSLVLVDVNNSSTKPIISQLVPQVKEQLQVGQTATIELGAVLSNQKYLQERDKIQDRITQLRELVSTQDMSGGWGNQEQVDTKLGFKSLTPEIVSVNNDGNVKALSPGQGLVKVIWGDISTVASVGVGEDAAHVVTGIGFEKPRVALVDVYKHQPPSARHWFGTDHQNRDIFSRVLMGTRQTLMIGFVSVAIGASLGTLLGLLAGFYGGKVDSLLSRATDVLLAFPGNLLAIAIIAMLGPGIYNIIFSVAVYSVPIFLRIVRSSTLSLKNTTYVEAARSVGVRNIVIIFRHIFPGTISVMLVYLTMRIGTAILIGASLSFLGLGGDITAPEWGAMLNAAKDNSRNVFHPNFFPGLAIVITVLSFNLLGDGLRDALDPKLQD